MRVAILSESGADEAAMRILVDAILGITTVPVAIQLVTRGWPDLPTPEIIAQEIIDDLEAALEQFATIAEDLKR